MISILVEVMEIPLRNTIVNDLFESFGQVNLEDCTNIKLKKTRRKHFKELTRLKKLGVLGNKSTSSYENRNKNQRKMSEKRVDNVLIINQPVDTKLNGKRNSHINFKESKSQSSNALLPKYHQSKLSVSAERSSGNRDSQIDHSNGDQGTRMDSPLLNSSNKEIAKESSKGEEIVLPTQNVKYDNFLINVTYFMLLFNRPNRTIVLISYFNSNNLQTQRRQSRNELSRSKKSIPNLQSQIEQEKEKVFIYFETLSHFYIQTHY